MLLVSVESDSIDHFGEGREYDYRNWRPPYCFVFTKSECCGGEVENREKNCVMDRNKSSKMKRPLRIKIISMGNAEVGKVSAHDFSTCSIYYSSLDCWSIGVYAESRSGSHTHRHWEQRLLCRLDFKKWSSVLGSVPWPIGRDAHKTNVMSKS